MMNLRASCVPDVATLADNVASRRRHRGPQLIIGALGRPPRSLHTRLEPDWEVGRDEASKRFPFGCVAKCSEDGRRGRRHTGRSLHGSDKPLAEREESPLLALF